MRKILIALGILVVACLILVGIAFAVAGPAISNVFNSTVALTDSATKFMTALKTEDYATAYGMAVPALQKDLGGSADGLKQFLENAGVAKPQSWKFSSFNITNDQGQVGGDLTYAGNVTKTANLVMQKSGDSWLISGISIK